MDEPRFYQRPWFYIFSWTLILGGFYLWQIRQLGGIWRSLGYIVFDAILFGLGLLIWLAVFAQFVLPVSTLSERQKILDRLMLYLAGAHGPAIFIRDGEPIEQQGEEKRKGPGVLWLDSASAAVTRTTTSYKQIIGPGVHFTETSETLAGSVDLHRQRQSLGPREKEDPFAEKNKEQSEEEYKEVQKRHLEVSAWTRDGVEVVPNVSVVFQIDADPVQGDVPGSHFADLEPFKDKPPEENPVFKAIVGEGIDPKALAENTRHIAWNQLPAHIAVDLWREYLAKFTLRQLFEASQDAPPPLFGLSEEAPVETLTPLSSSPAAWGPVSSILHKVNELLARWADRCEPADEKDTYTLIEEPLQRTDAPLPSKKVEKLTALQVINHMLKMRMTQSNVVELDSQGRLDHTKQHTSKEYQILIGRGLRIHSVSVSNIRLNPSVEDQLIGQWEATWLQNAKAEKAQIDRLRSFTEIKSQVEGSMEYAVSLGKSLKEEKPPDTKATIRTLLLRSRNELVKNDRFHRQAGMEREELEEIIQWVERNGE